MEYTKREEFGELLMGLIQSLRSKEVTDEAQKIRDHIADSISEDLEEFSRLITPLVENDRETAVLIYGMLWQLMSEPRGAGWWEMTARNGAKMRARAAGRVAPRAARLAAKCVRDGHGGRTRKRLGWKS